MTFTLDPRLIDVAVEVCDLALAHVRFMRDERVAWAMVIPRVDGATELHDLDDADTIQLAREIRAVSVALTRSFPCDKVNVGMFGHGVPQLHVHVAARRHDDAAWPRPIFMTDGPTRAEDATVAMAETLRAALAEEMPR